MKYLLFRKPGRLIRFGFFLFLLSAASVARAEDLYIISKLFWGTNEQHPSDANLKPVDAATRQKFANVFKWKNYFEVNRKEVKIPSRSTRQIEMSKQCTVEIEELEGPKVAVTLIGQGKPQKKIIKALSKGECFTIAGEAKNESAWFVVISQVDAKDFKMIDPPRSQLPVAKVK
ncbi:MAG TPA: hypothetical protein VGE41_12000 [Verrucomicrobiae bacterium]